MVKKYYLYRHYDIDDCLLYVGITNNMTRRQTQHSCRSPWFSNVYKITQQIYNCKKDALYYEWDTIMREEPLFNGCKNKEVIFERETWAKTSLNKEEKSLFEKAYKLSGFPSKETFMRFALLNGCKSYIKHEEKRTEKKKRYEKWI